MADNATGDPQVNININVDDQQARAEGQRAGEKTGEGFFSGVKSKLKGNIDKEFSALADRIGASLRDAFNDSGLKEFVAQQKAASDATQRMASNSERLRDAMNDAGQGARQAAGFTKTYEERLQDLNKDLIAGRERAEAFREGLRRAGAPEGLFAGVARQLDVVESNFRQFSGNIERISENPELFDGMEKNLKAELSAMYRDMQSGVVILKGLSRAQSDATQGATAQRIQEEKRATQQLRGEYGLQISETQATGAKEVAVIKSAAADKLQSDRATARIRLEVLKNLFRQVQIIERSIGAVFKGTAAVVSGAFARVESTVFRIAGVFRRGNSDYTAGLSPALAKREGILRRSFGRQEADVRSSVARQSATIQRFETQASKGVAGALTGRSSLGALFGGGLAIGGGFAAFQGLREGFKVGGDFVQGLAVLQAQLQLTEAQMVGVRQLAIDLGNDLTLPGVSALDAAEAISLLAKQFGSLGDQALPAAEAAAKGVLQLSRATGSSAEEAAQVVGAAINVFGISADRAVQVADQVTAAMTKAAGVGFNEFSQSFKQAASVVGLFQVPAAGAEGALTELNTALAVLAKGGLVGSDAGTSLKQFFLQANRGAPETVKKLNLIADRAGVVGGVFFDQAGGARKLSDSLVILRKGLDGLTDQERILALQKIFGSDAARAAGILVNESADSYAALAAAQQRAGAAAEIAAAQNVGLRGALDALDSVIETQQIKTYEGYQEVLGKVVLKFADLLNAFFESGGAVKALRAGLKGAAVALAGLLAAKAAAEGLKFLAIAARALLTPLGAVVTAFAVLGAAINILREASPEFRVALDQLGRELLNVFGGVLRYVTDNLQRFGDFLAREVLPRVVDFAIFLVNNVKPALFAVGRFLNDTFGPALVKVGSVLRDSVIPFVIELGDLLVGKVLDGITKFRDIAVSLFDTVQPYIQPAIDGFRDLGGAILAAFTEGDFSGLIDGFKGLATGIGTTLGNIASVAIDALGPQLQRVLSFIQGYFTAPRLSSIASAFLGVVQTIGRILGTIATDPRVIKALGTIVLVAAVIAANFIKGFAEGVQKNLPGLARLLGNTLKTAVLEGLKFAFNNPVLIGKIILAAFAVNYVIQAFNRIGQQGALATAKGFATGLRTGVTGGARQLQGLFGGTGSLEASARRSAVRAATAFQSNYDRKLRDLQRLGEKGPTKSVVGKASINDLRGLDAQLRITKGRLGEFGTQGALTRARIGEAFAGMSQVARGAKEVFNGVRFDFADKGAETIRGGFGKIGNAVRDGFIDARARFQESGRTAGQALGGAVLAGLGSAMSGQQLGKGNKLIGISGIIGSGLLALQATNSPLIAGAVVGIGLITAAWTASGEAAKRAKELADSYVQALKDLDTPAARLEAAIGKVDDAITGADINQQRLLEGFDVGAFVSNTVDGTGAVEAALDAMGRQFDISGETLRSFGEQFNFESFGRLKSFLLEDTAASRALRSEISDAGLSVREFQDIMGLLSGEGGAITTALESLRLQGTRIGGAETTGELNDGLGEAVDLTDQLSVSFADLPTQLSQTQQAINDSLRNPVERARVSVSQLDSAFETLNAERIQRLGLTEAIADVTTQLDLARQASQDAAQSLRDYFNPSDNNLQDTVDQLVLSIPSIASALKDATEVAPLKDAAVRQALKPLSDGVSNALLQGFEAEGGLSKERAKEIVQPLFDAVSGLVLLPKDKGGISQAQANEILKPIQDKLDDQDFAALVDYLNITKQAEIDLQAELDGLNLQVNADVVFSAAQIQDAIAQLFGDAIAAQFDPGAALDRQFNSQQANQPGFLPGLGADFNPSRDLVNPVAAARQTSAVPLAGELTPTTPAPVTNINVNQQINVAKEPIQNASEIVRATVAAASGNRFVPV